MDAQRKSPAEAGPERAWDAAFGNNHTAADRLLQRLDKVRETGPDSWLARCPAHDDKNPSLSIRQADDRLLIYCHAGCDALDVAAACGLTLADLYDKPLTHRGRPLTQRQRHRYGQAQDALKVLDHEATIVAIAAQDIADGFAVDKDTHARLKVSLERIKEIMRIAA